MNSLLEPQINLFLNEQTTKITNNSTESIIATFSGETADDNDDNLLFPNTELRP